MLEHIDLKHAELVKRLAKPGDVIAGQLSGTDAHLIHMVLGICGEAGELLDAIKKTVIYQKPLDDENVIEELGDLEFFLSGLRTALGIERADCLQANITKLEIRYPDATYSDKDAQDRADKSTDQADAAPLSD